MRSRRTARPLGTTLVRATRRRPTENCTDLHPPSAASLPGVWGGRRARRGGRPAGRGAGGVDQQAQAVAAADDGQRRLGWAEHLDAAAGGARRATSRRSVASARVGAETTSAASRPKGGRPPARARRSRARRRHRGARDDRPHHRMIGLEGLQRPRLFLPVRPARPVTWLSSWNVRSAARGSPLARPRSASTTPTSVSCGKLWPLATSCVPMTMSASPAAMASVLAALEPPHAADQVGRQQRWCARREMRRRPPRRCARRPGRRRPEGRARRIPGRPRGGARCARNGGRRAGREADARPARPSSRAAEAMAANPAQRQRRIAAPVEEQQRLLASPALRRMSSTSTGDRKPPRAGGSRRRSIVSMSGRAASAKRAESTTWS